MNIFLAKVRDLPPAERIRSFERYLKHLGMTRSQIATAIAHIKKGNSNEPANN